jgi:hypothetical protein
MVLNSCVQCGIQSHTSIYSLSLSHSLSLSLVLSLSLSPTHTTHTPVVIAPGVHQRQIQGHTKARVYISHTHTHGTNTHTHTHTHAHTHTRVQRHHVNTNTLPGDTNGEDTERYHSAIRPYQASLTMSTPGNRESQIVCLTLGRNLRRLPVIWGNPCTPYRFPPPISWTYISYCRWNGNTSTPGGEMQK